MSYLFVNKNPDSDSIWRTSREDKINVNRHVQQGRPRAKQRLKIDADKSRTSSRVLRWRIREPSMSSVKLFTNLSAGRIDPFITYPVPEEVTLSSKAILDHAVQHTWPSIVPTQDRLLTYPVRTAWLEHIRVAPASLYAYMYCGAVHKAFLKSGPQGLVAEARQLLELKVKALYHLRQCFTDFHRSIPDHLFTTIIALASHEVHPRALEFSQRRYSKSPMASTQILDLVSNMTFVPTHMDALYKLVAQKGGLKNIHTYGVASTVALADLMFSTVNIVKPRFECYWEADSRTNIRCLKADIVGIGLLGKGFEALGTDLKQSLCEFMSFLPSICQVVLQIDEYHWTNGRSPSLVDILQRRNYVQWHLLFLWSKAASNPINEDQKIYCAVMISALIFSDMVIFPLGPALGHRSLLAEMLRSTLNGVPMCNLALQIWLLTIGGLAAKHDCNEAWYLEQFARAAAMLDIASKDLFHETVAQFLWWDVECLDPATNFWNKACAQEVKKECLEPV